MAHIYIRQFAGKGVLYFGTAGKGGYLYVVDVKSGEMVFKFKTSARSILL